MIVYYFDNEGYQQGVGESHTLVPGSTVVAPPHELSRWNVDHWVTPSVIYYYDPISYEYTDEGFADLDPLDFADLVPSNATKTPLPAYDAETQFPVFQDGDWIIQSISLDVFRGKRREELKQLRDSIIFSPFNGVQVSDARSREDVKGSIEYFESLDGGTGIIEWIMSDNTVAPLTKAELTAVKDGFVYRKAQTFNQYKAAILLLEAATTKEEIEGITL